MFSSSRTSTFDLYLKMADGPPGSEQLLLTTPLIKAASDWSSDGRFLLFRSLDPKTNYDIWCLPMSEGDRKPFPVVQTSAIERDAKFSPDGKWIAYQSNESDRFEVYIQPFPGPGGRQVVSTNGGAQPQWSRDGKELFYSGLDDRFMAVPVRLDPNKHGRSRGRCAPVPNARWRRRTSCFYAAVHGCPGRPVPDDAIADEGNVSPITVVLNSRL